MTATASTGAVAKGKHVELGVVLRHPDRLVASSGHGGRPGLLSTEICDGGTGAHWKSVACCTRLLYSSSLTAFTLQF